MARLRYGKRGVTLSRGGLNDPRCVIDLQHHLRALGYLRSGVDGTFGRKTESAVRALKYDLLHNYGKGPDGSARVSVLDYNRHRVFRVDGEVDTGVAGCIADMMNDPDFPKLPKTEDPAAENRHAAEKLKSMKSGITPIPFLMAILRQESGLKHFVEPRGIDQDRFILVGLDTNASDKSVITSRGYGMGQYTLFHHPPQIEEINELMLDPVKNVQKAIRELKTKFDGFVNGATPGTCADDRVAEAGRGPLRVCAYAPDDPRHLADCRNCAMAAGKRNIISGVTPVFKGSPFVFEPTPCYKNASYSGVPVRGKFSCDWPYAARRYNGAGINSYHYQTRILRNLLIA